MIIPLGVDVPFDRRPFLNWLVVIGCVAVFGLQVFAMLEDRPEAVREYMLDGYTLKGFFGHMWLHADPLHLIGNMIFLWIFGNAVCSKIGNLMYLPVYIFLGLVAAVTYTFFSHGLALGASGAVNGIVGMYLIFFPLNDITCLWWFGYYYAKEFSLSSYWMILFWLAFDIYGAVSGGRGVGYTAHIGGFVAGVSIASGLLLLRIVRMEDDERSLLQIFGVKLEPKRQKNDWHQVAPSGPKEEAIRRAAMERKLADQREEQEVMERIAGRDLRFAYQMEHRSEPAPAPDPTPAPKPKKVDPKVIRFACICGQKIKVPIKYAGKRGKCPGCANRVEIPG